MGKIIVMAGTPVDTQMGVEVIERSGNEAIFCPVSSNPTEQTLFQLIDEETKRREIIRLLNPYKGEAKKVFVYCNSLSAAVDFKAVAKETGMQIVTPLDVYEEIAKSHKYHKLAVIAANPQSSHGITKLMYEIDSNLSLIGMGYLDLVFAIESKMDPLEMIKRFRLVELLDWFQANSCEAMLLACTHFPYFEDQLIEKTTLPVIDPAKEMLRMLGL